MKRILAILSFLLLMSTPVFAGVITVDAFLTSDDVTIAHLEQFRTRVVGGMNNFDGNNIQSASIPHTALDANSDPVNRWSESFNNYVFTGLLPAIGTRAGSVTSAGTAYIEGTRVVKDAVTPGATNYPATSYIYVDLSNTGTYTYPATVIGAAVPAVTTNSLRLARVTTNATDVTAVRDDRVTSISLSTEEFYRQGLTIITGDSTTLTVDAGITNTGAIKTTKSSVTGLSITNAADYISGVVESTANNPLFIYINDTGEIKLSASAPDYHDTTGNTAGQLYYFKYAPTSIYWKNLGYLILSGSTIISSDASVITTSLANKVVQIVNKQDGTSLVAAAVIPMDNTIPQITEGFEFLNLAIKPTSATNKLKIDVVFQGKPDGAELAVALFRDAVANALACVYSHTAAGEGDTLPLTYYMTAGTTNQIVFRVRAGSESGNVSFNEGTAGALFGGKMASSITITEITQ